MNPQLPQLAAELFLRASEDGPVDVPPAVREMFEELSSHEAQPSGLDMADLEERVVGQVSSWKNFNPAGTLEPDQAEKWVKALRWVLQELHSWTPEDAVAWVRLKVLLTAVAAFDADNAGVDAVLQQFTASPLLHWLPRSLERAEVVSIGPGAESGSWCDEVRTAAREGDYEQLGMLTRHAHLRLSLADRLAIYLLWQTQTDSLVQLIDQRNDAIFSYAACEVLSDSAPQIALDVQDTTFKFFSANSIASLSHQGARESVVEVFCELLLQNARSDDWRAWMQAFYRYPKGDTIPDVALSQALARLHKPHWADFVSAVELWTNQGTAAPVANILIRFDQNVGDLDSREMWSLAHERWDRWDYGREEENFYMFAPASCSFDFPVALHYAHLPSKQLKAEEEKLLDAIRSVEQEWFSSLSALITHRNRLLSRLRLVQHGQALASGLTKEPLPELPQPDSKYAAIRYMYHDVNSPPSA